MLQSPPGLELLAPLKAHKTVQATIVQTKTMKAFKRPQVARGRLLIRPPRQLRWEYTEPFKAILVLNGDDASMSWPDLDRKQRIDLKRDPQMRAVLDSILFFMEAAPDAVSKRFTVRKSEAGTIELVPRQEAARALLAFIVVAVDPQKQVLSRIELHEPDGDYTVIAFHDVVTNAPIDPKLLVP